MTGVLYLKSSPRGAASHSSELGDELVAQLVAHDPGAKVVTRDLAGSPVPHIDPAYVIGRYLPLDQRSPLQAQAVIPSDALIAELKAADIVVLASAMINFTVSAPLKAWIDQIIRHHATYAIEGNRPVGLVTGKKVYLIATRGGAYADPQMAAFDFQLPYLRTVLGFLGMTDVEVIVAEGLSMGPQIADPALAAARARIAAIVPTPPA